MDKPTYEAAIKAANQAASDAATASMMKAGRKISNGDDIEAAVIAWHGTMTRLGVVWVEETLGSSHISVDR